MKKYFIPFLMALTISLSCYAIRPPDEGMWLPMLIDRLNYVDMQKEGLHLTAEELYSVNHSSLKDAIVGLTSPKYEAQDMFFCSAEVVSHKGLLLTNHHCGFDAIQEQSTLDHDYLTQGFWALKNEEELPCEGVSAAFLVRMENVTDIVLAKMTDDMSDDERESVLASVAKKLEKENSEKNKYKVDVKGFFENNEFYMFVYQVYRDVRLVGAPPSSIGKFGGDTDNWMWPRHTGDFSMLRIYAAPDGTPAPYSKSNVPLNSITSLPVSIKGVKKNDFAMIWGYPGTTERFLTSYGVNLAIEESNPTLVKVRDAKLAIIKQEMEKDPKIRLQYAAKYSASANYWKFFIGETKQLKRNGVMEKKKALEEAFIAWANADAERKKKYDYALTVIQQGYDELKKYEISWKYLNEAVFEGPEFILFSWDVNGLYGKLKTQAETKDKTAKAMYDSDIKILSDAYKAVAIKFFKDYNKDLDKKLFIALLKMYYEGAPKDQQPKIFADIEQKYKGDFCKWADYVYSRSIFTDENRLMAFLEKPTYKVISTDPGWAITFSMIEKYLDLSGSTAAAKNKISSGDHLFVKGLREMNPDKKWYPDANSTMRMTYGQVLDYKAADAVNYDYFTTLKGVIEKEDTANSEFIVSEKLKQLYNSGDFGRYGQDGKMPVCFIANLDITGGNSGSAVMNGDGQLIGIAFDGNWEAMSGDIYYEPAVQRTICVDIRYVLFIIDKYAGAGNLVNEMNIIQ